MLSLIDFLAQIEQSRMSLTPTGQERLEQLAYSTEKRDQKTTSEGRKPLGQPIAVPAHCCSEATV